MLYTQTSSFVYICINPEVIIFARWKFREIIDKAVHTGVIFTILMWLSY